MASRVMRRLLVDQARARRAAKRGGGAEAVELDEALWVSEPQADALAELDDALQRLEAIDPRQGQIVEQRYFGGLIARRNRRSDWRLARDGETRAAVCARLAGGGTGRGRRARSGGTREGLGGAEGSVLGRRRQRARRTRTSDRGAGLDRSRAGRSHSKRCWRPTTGGRSLQHIFQADDVVPRERPARIGTYEVTGVLGVGGMGEVYRAHDPRLHRDVAIKVLPAALASDPERLARFEREAQVLASLNHPHIAQVYGLDESGGTPALVMELVEGPTLATVIADQRDAIAALSRALAIARQIADGLDAAHEKGIIHRDLKPGNIALTPDGRRQDSRLRRGQRHSAPDDAAGDAAATDVGVVLGTPAYMSPEQARGLTVDKRTDIWAFGCVLYELLTGTAAVSVDTPSDILVAATRS